MRVHNGAGTQVWKDELAHDTVDIQPGEKNEKKYCENAQNKFVKTPPKLTLIYSSVTPDAHREDIL